MSYIQSFNSDYCQLLRKNSEEDKINILLMRIFYNEEVNQAKFKILDIIKSESISDIPSIRIQTICNMILKIENKVTEMKSFQKLLGDYIDLNM